MIRWLKVWWHCLWRTFVKGHRMCWSYPDDHYCECGFEMPQHLEGLIAYPIDKEKRT
jgi:hypothetical protein